ncbi:unnamed protein product [Parajaminaea phylloscopi]
MCLSFWWWGRRNRQWDDSDPAGSHAVNLRTQESGQTTLVQSSSFGKLNSRAKEEAKELAALHSAPFNLDKPPPARPPRPSLREPLRSTAIPRDEHKSPRGPLSSQHQPIWPTRGDPGYLQSRRATGPDGFDGYEITYGRAIFVGDTAHCPEETMGQPTRDAYLAEPPRDVDYQASAQAQWTSSATSSERHSNVPKAHSATTRQWSPPNFTLSLASLAAAESAPYPFGAGSQMPAPPPPLPHDYLVDRQAASQRQRALYSERTLGPPIRMQMGGGSAHELCPPAGGGGTAMPPLIRSHSATPSTLSIPRTVTPGDDCESLYTEGRFKRRHSVCDSDDGCESANELDGPCEVLASPPRRRSSCKYPPAIASYGDHRHGSLAALTASLPEASLEGALQPEGRLSEDSNGHLTLLFPAVPNERI